MKGIKYVAWRNGEPRFTPGVNLRVRGYKSFALKHTDGTWYSWFECQQWSKRFSEKLQREHGTTRKLAPNAIEETREEPFHGNGSIYFLWVGDAIKIGFSKDPVIRLSQLRPGLSDKPKMIVCFPGTMRDEKRLHRRLKAQKLRGEWFRANPTVIAVMQYAMADALDLRD